MSYVYVPQTVISKKNLHQMAEGKDKKSTTPNKQLRDNDTTDDEPINPNLKTSALATQAALSHSCTQANPTMEQGSSHTKRVKKLTKVQAADKFTQLIPKRNKSKWLLTTLYDHI